MKVLVVIVSPVIQRDIIPVRPHELPVAQMMKLDPFVLRLPSSRVPFNSFRYMTLYVVKSSFEEIVPHPVWISLYIINKYQIKAKCSFISLNRMTTAGTLKHKLVPSLAQVH